MVKAPLRRMNTCSLLQTAWLASCLPAAFSFKKQAAGDLRKVQENCLLEILRANSGTAFGAQHGFAAIDGYDSFRKAVPIREYSDLEPWIERAAAGEPRVLTADPITLFETTSGSSDRPKLIPYGQPLQRSFNRALHPWMIDLYNHTPGLWGGPSYWVVTPRSDTGRKTSGGIPIGFATDSEYFGKVGKWLVEPLMAVPSAVQRLPGLELWRYVTLLCLLRRRDLRLVSLWNPTFLPILLDGLFSHGDRLLEDLAEGTCRRAPREGSRPMDERDFSGFVGMPSRERADEVGRLLKAGSPNRKHGLGTALWPYLALISTWTEGTARENLSGLRDLFPDVPIQGKGLLATEGVVTFPLHDAPAPVLAVASAFFEFREGAAGEGRILPGWEMERGGTYRVIMTTPGGLYRYPLHDLVRHEGFYRSIPCFSFQGKEAGVVDLRGEKLHPDHVEKLLAEIFPPGSGAFLAPGDEGDNGSIRYVLFHPCEASNHAPERIQEILETGLRKNPQYAWCRENGQLAPVEIRPLALSVDAMRSAMAAWRAREGGIPGTMKFPALSPLRGWQAAFEKQES